MNYRHESDLCIFGCGCTSTDGSLSFAEAMALPLEEVEVWGKERWEPVIRPDNYPSGQFLLTFLRNAKFRRSRPKRSRIDKMAEAHQGKAPSDPQAAYEMGLDDAIRAACNLAEYSNIVRMSGDDWAHWVREQFLEPR